MRRQQARPDTIVCLRGNHEQMALMAHEDERAMPMWLQNSGASTQRSYWRTDGRIAEAHLAWLRALPLCHDDGLRFFVHAGVDLTVPLDQQARRRDAVDARAVPDHCDHVDCGRFIVHGHTPLRTGEPDLRKHRVNLDTAAVIGGPLTAAVFDDTRPEPLEFLTAREGGWRDWLR